MDDVPLSECEAALNDDSASCSGKAAATANEEPPVERESSQAENRCTNKQDEIALQERCAAPEFIGNEMVTMVEEELDDDLPKTICNTQIGV